ncbi:hypothetical protein N499_0411 [Wolbachia pipientis wVitA]|nr:hypothetical protein N499_0411 [Wolbachia pipientis wVitA]
MIPSNLLNIDIILFKILIKCYYDYSCVLMSMKILTKIKKLI